MKNLTQLANRIYCIVFMLFMIIPLLLMNREEGAQAVNENRPLAYRPNFHTSEGEWNLEYTSQLDHYLDDRIGFRYQLVASNAWVQYYLFDRMENQNKYALGRNGEFFNIEDNTLPEYQHANLYSDDQLEIIANAFQSVSDSLSERNIQFYYMQCWSKETLYPEYFPATVMQYGSMSATEQVVRKLESSTSVNLIPLIDEFRNQKSDYEIYSKWGDPVHWTPRGALLGYQLMMNEINKHNQGVYKVLSEDDFIITNTDQGAVYFGGIHHVNYSENFELCDHNADAKDTTELSDVFTDKRCFWFTNPNVQNNTKILILGNSFIANYILEDIAQSFSETLFVWEGLGESAKAMIDAYEPDIVLAENTQRYNHFDDVVAAADSLCRKD